MSEEFLRTHVLPRLDQLEIEVKFLRDATWPVCQGIRESHGCFQFLTEKRKFFRILHKDEAIELLRLKAKFKGITDPVILDQELQSICTVHFDGSVSEQTLRAKEQA